MRNKNITTFIFDFGGVVLTHPKSITPDILAQVFHLPIETAQAIYREHRNDWRTGKLTTDIFFEFLRKKFAPDSSVQDLKDRWVDIYKSIANIDEKVITTIKKLRKSYRVVVLTNTLDLHGDYNEKRGAFSLFDKVYRSYRIGFAKPDDQAFLYVVSDMRVTPEECCFVDDKEENIRVAERLGMHAYLFEGTEKFVNDMQHFITVQ